MERVVQSSKDLEPGTAGAVGPSRPSRNSWRGEKVGDGGAGRAQETAERSRVSGVATALRVARLRAARDEPCAASDSRLQLEVLKQPRPSCYLGNSGRPADSVA